ncbi:MAG: DNA-formamidopyrimidine glycosylase family protein [Bacillota bacterium]|nr:DNA-formamidopyrimidine glycosylase family protein [Bacillota bacterium]
MPELPEMENYRILLKDIILEKEIETVTVNRDKSINLRPELFKQQIEGTIIVDIERYGKQLLFKLSTGNYLLLHLMLGGWIYLAQDSSEEVPVSQVIITFTSGERLCFPNLRLGYLHLIHQGELTEKLKLGGPDVFSKDFSQEYLSSVLHKKRAQLKGLLTDQKLMAGIGNAYADEICFDAKVRPVIKAQALTHEEIANLYHGAFEVLKKAVQLGGYMDYPLFIGDNLTGGYNNHFLVYDRGGEECPRCPGTIVKEIKGGRKIFYCPLCQKE